MARVKDGVSPREQTGVTVPVPGDHRAPRRFFVAGARLVRSRLADAGWLPTRRWDAHLYWRPQVPSLAAYASLPPGMRVNHLPGIGVLTSPLRLPKALTRAAVAVAGRPGAPDHRFLWSDKPAAADDDSAPRAVSRFVLIRGVDPLRVYVHGAGAAVDAELEAGLRRIIVVTILAGRDVMAMLVRDVLTDRDSCFEVLRFDFRIDGMNRPWLVRCALSPSLDEVPSVVDDTLALVGILPEAADEERSRGSYVRLVPSPEPALWSLAASMPRHADVVLAERLAPGSSLDLRVVARAAEGFVGGALVLFNSSTQRFYVPNETATYVWLRLGDASPDDIAQELHHRFAVPIATAREDVLEIVARWTYEGLVGRAGDAPIAPEAPSVATAPPEPPAGTVGLRLRVIDRTWFIAFSSHEELLGMSSPFLNLRDESSSLPDHWVAVEPLPGLAAGFRIRSSEGDVAECGQQLEIAPLIRRWMVTVTRERCPSFVSLPGIAVVASRAAGASRGSGASIVLAGPEAEGAAAVAVALAARGHSLVAIGAVLLDERDGAPRPLPLGLEVSELDLREVEALHPHLTELPLWTLPSELRAKYLVRPSSRGDAPRATALILVCRAPAGVPTSLRAIGGAVALRELTRQGLNAAPPLDDERARRLLAWFDTTACFQLELGDLTSAADLVDGLLGSELDAHGG